MDKHDNQGAGSSVPPANNNGNGKEKEPSRLQVSNGGALTGNHTLIEQIRQIISETPEIRPEKVGPLHAAVDQGAYDIDVRTLANILIAKLFLDA